ncbi:hypothetical protein V8D89_013853 [Ganoderma adspersum]
MATPEVHQLLIDTVTCEHNCVLQFDSEHQVLSTWLWPKDHSGALVALEKLREHRTSYDFLGPCCFCPALRGKNSTNFVEAAMFDGGNDEFVAMCPTDNCSYVVFLGRIFEKGDRAIRPPRVFHRSEDTENVFGRADVENIDLTDSLPGLSPARRALPCSVKYRALLVKLDSIVQPGVPENTLSLLLAKCKKCGQVTTRCVFLHHT